MKKRIISVIGPDQPGIIAAVTRILYQENCNIENVSQTILQGEFSGIFIVLAPDALSSGMLQGTLRTGLSPMDQHVHVKPITRPFSKPAFEKSEPFVITSRGPDQMGLVAAITGIIASYGINVTNLQAVFKGGDNPVDNVMIYEVDMPGDTDFSRFNGELRTKARNLGLDINIQHRKIFETINRV